MDFDPIEFLELDSLESEEKERIRPKLFEHMAWFLINRFLEDFDEGKLEKFEAELADKSGEEVLELIKGYDPDFEQKKIGWLEEYRVNFDLSKFYEEMKNG